VGNPGLSRDRLRAERLPLGTGSGLKRDFCFIGGQDEGVGDGEIVTLTLGPRSEQEIRSAREREVEAASWTSLDRALRDLSGEAC
jgi:hypothetical protein